MVRLAISAMISLVACNSSAPPAPTAGSASSERAAVGDAASSSPSSSAAIGDAASASPSSGSAGAVVSDAGSSAATGSGSSLAEIVGGVRRGDGCVDCIGQTDVIREDPGPQAKIEVVATTTSKPSSLTPTMIGARVKSSYLYELRRCYARQSWTGKAASGDVTVSFEVNEAAVTKRFRASGFDRMLDRCILGLLPDWKFPKPLDPQSGKPIGGTTYTITLRFTAR